MIIDDGKTNLIYISRNIITIFEMFVSAIGVISLELTDNWWNVDFVSDKLYEIDFTIYINLSSTWIQCWVHDFYLCYQY